jgi:hypothetical protein
MSTMRSPQPMQQPMQQMQPLQQMPEISQQSNNDDMDDELEVPAFIRRKLK